ncbi:hypothetical protein A8709_04515 [Paenibacillus pectinilyticus]|uniref:Lipoprotein n=1 Tax=Paenibacillus pectinilyticus TaxID=512399 RepID=A0A1C0ZSC5_9BACL|nr:membrane lipoprotein lipid attachment site-containing protein [Paenibacillus pectinilyticus]OCT10972.1 hypothetical protein A8709_04515 [Paenibacillus pectinilyticus]
MRKILISLGAVLVLASCSSYSNFKESSTSSTTTSELATPQVFHPTAVALTSMHQQDPPGYVSTPNHSSTINKEEVLTPTGKANLLTIEQDNFTAVTEHEPGAKTDTVYWLYITKPSPTDNNVNDTYILSGLVTGDAALAKSEMLEAAKTWNPLNR